MRKILDTTIETLKDGPILAKEMKKYASEMAYNWRTVGKAKKKTGVVSKRVGYGPGAKHYWLLKGDEDSLPE